MICDTAEGRPLGDQAQIKKGGEIPQEFGLISPAEKIPTQLCDLPTPNPTATGTARK